MRGGIGKRLSVTSSILSFCLSCRRSIACNILKYLFYDVNWNWQMLVCLKMVDVHTKLQLIDAERLSKSFQFLSRPPKPVKVNVPKAENLCTFRLAVAPCLRHHLWCGSTACDQLCDRTRVQHSRKLKLLPNYFTTNTSNWCIDWRGEFKCETSNLIACPN